MAPKKKSTRTGGAKRGAANPAPVPQVDVGLEDLIDWLPRRQPGRAAKKSAKPLLADKSEPSDDEAKPKPKAKAGSRGAGHGGRAAAPARKRKAPAAEDDNVKVDAPKRRKAPAKKAGPRKKGPARKVAQSDDVDDEEEAGLPPAKTAQGQGKADDVVAGDDEPALAKDDVKDDTQVATLGGDTTLGDTLIETAEVVLASVSSTPVARTCHGVECEMQYWLQVRQVQDGFASRLKYALTFGFRPAGSTEFQDAGRLDAWRISKPTAASPNAEDAGWRTHLL